MSSVSSNKDKLSKGVERDIHEISKRIRESENDTKELEREKENLDR
jgi:hypothetical protein